MKSHAHAAQTPPASFWGVPTKGCSSYPAATKLNTYACKLEQVKTKGTHTTHINVKCTGWLSIQQIPQKLPQAWRTRR